MPLIKTLSQTLKQDKEKFKVPRSVQQAIPIRKIWPDGIFQVESKFSRTFRFTDINYSIASKADKTEMFLDYSELLNALDSGCTAKITLNNRKINKEEFEQSLLIPMKGDGLDEYRKEYNDMTEEEYAEFAERLSAYNMSQAEFIRQAITGAAIRPIITVSPVNDELLAAVGKLTAEYGRIGGNLNQIARTLNEWHSPYPQLAGEVRAAVSDLAALKFEILQKVGDAVGNIQTYQL